MRGDIENEIISYIHNNGPKNQQSILSLIEMELAYMNIRHDEFMNSAIDDGERYQNESNLENGNIENSSINGPDNESVSLAVFFSLT